MSNYFYHPLGDYAQNYVNNSATFSQQPHTRNDHGFSKIDFGVGGNLPVYSMTNGTLTTFGWCGNDGVSKYGAVVKTSECGYSQMMAKIKGGERDNFPIYFTYIELDSLNDDLEVGVTISKGTVLGYTNSEYAGSNLHFDIQPYDRFSGDNAGGANTWYGCISLGQKDAYGDKGNNYNLKDYLDENFSIDNNGNLIDSTGKTFGIKSGSLYYPPNSGGGAVLENTVFSGMNNSEVEYIGGPSMAINRWYSFATLLQTPIYISEERGD